MALKQHLDPLWLHSVLDLSAGLQALDHDVITYCDQGTEALTQCST